MKKATTNVFCGIICALLIFPSKVSSQQVWQRHYGDTCYDESYSIKLLHDSRAYALCGYSCSFLNGDDVYLLKVNQNGTLAASSATNIYGMERGYSVVDRCDTVSNAAKTWYLWTTGNTYYPTAPLNNDLFIMKANYASCAPTSIKTFGTNNRDDFGKCIIKTSDERLLSVGYSELPNGSANPCILATDLFVVKVDENNNLVWEKYFDINGGEDYAYKVIEDGTDYVITGNTYQECDSSQIFILKLDAAGNIKWLKLYGILDINEFAYSIIKTKDNHYLVVGHTEVAGSGPDILVLKTDLNGNEIWAGTYNTVYNNEENYGRDIIDVDTNYVMTGYSDILFPTSYDMHLIKITKNGIPVWNYFYGGIRDDRGYALTSDTKIESTGYSHSFSNGLSDVYLVKSTMIGKSCEYDTMNLEYRIDSIPIYLPPIIADSIDTFATPNFNYVLPIKMDSICTDSDYFYMRSAHHFDIDNSEDNLSVYPNPIEKQDFLIVKSSDINLMQADVCIFDCTGRIVFNKKIPLQGSNYKIPVSNLVPGIYLISINSTRQTKFIIK